MDLILLNNGEQIERTHFLKDIQLGNRLFSYKKKSNRYNDSDPIIEYEVVKIGRKYAEIVEVLNNGNLSNYYRYKMLLSNGSVYQDKSTQINFDLYSSRDELLASIQNNRSLNELKDKFSDSIFKKGVWDKLQPKHIKRLNDIVEEMLNEE